MHIVILLTLLGSIFFIEFMNYLEKRDITFDPRLKLKEKNKMLILICFFLIALLLYKRYGTTIIMFTYYITAVYLSISAYIDFKVNDVYDFFNILMFIVSVIFTMYIGVKADVRPLLESLIICTIVGIVKAKFKMWGKGDTLLLIAIALIIGSKGYVYINNIKISMSIVSIVIAYYIAGIKVIYLLITKKAKVTSNIPMVPALALSCIFIFILL